MARSIKIHVQYMVLNMSKTKIEKQIMLRKNEIMLLN